MLASVLWASAAAADGLSGDLDRLLSPFIPTPDIVAFDAPGDDGAAADADAARAATGEPNGASPKPDPEPLRITAADTAITPFSPRLLAEFYAERDYTPAWDEARAREMLVLARESRFDGLSPSDFHADAIAEVLGAGALDGVETTQRRDAELLLSDALARYVHHFRFGKHNPERVNSGQNFVEPADAEQLKADMRAAMAGEVSMADALTARLPSPDFYRNLKKGYRRYLTIAERHTWRDIPDGPNLTIGIEDPRVPMIREHLQVLDGYEAEPVGEPEIYDEALAEAIRGFQRRSGLSADGVVGPNTLRALNQPLDERMASMRANLERIRWLYNDLPEDYLFVDLAAYDLHLVRAGEEVWRTKGIIGTVEDQTPMFRDEMEYLVFNPTWTVPRSIEEKIDGVPKGYKRVRSGGQYYLVQEPGPKNALGRVKFMFPNGHAIYLHDTPSRYLFKRSRRAYSHGCIRVYKPLTLAEQILNKPAWGERQINSVVKRGSTRWVHLDEHLTVLLYYLTAFADDEGRVGFRRDVYKRDPKLISALDEPAGDEGRIVFQEPQPVTGSELAASVEPATEPRTEPAAGPAPEPEPQPDAVAVEDAESGESGPLEGEIAEQPKVEDAEAESVDHREASTGGHRFELSLSLDAEGRFAGSGDFRLISPAEGTALYERAADEPVRLDMAQPLAPIHIPVQDVTLNSAALLDPTPAARESILIGN
jgi:murein L,D-transpeptidase YcbB/YkuD